jgi:hypothetical protein
MVPNIAQFLSIYLTPRRFILFLEDHTLLCGQNKGGDFMDFIAENKNQTNRIRSLKDKLIRNWKTELGNGWTVGSMLCHIAFWDNVRCLWIKKWIQSGKLATDLDMESTHSFNDVVRTMSETIPAKTGLQFTLRCAEEIDRLVESLQPNQIQELEASDRGRWFQRHLHRKSHLDRIETAVG